MMKAKQKATTGRATWMMYAKGYFGLAKIGLSELSSPKHISRKTGFDYLWIHEAKLPLMAILWNIKHGLEISMKGLNINIDGHYEKHHDIGELKSGLVQALKPFGIKGDNRVFEFARLVDKYYTCRFWENKLSGGITITDVKNDLFRYPENEAKCTIDTTLLKKMGRAEVKELQGDLDRIEAIFNVMHSQVTKKKLGLL